MRADADPHALAVRHLAAAPIQLPSALPRTGQAPLVALALFAAGLVAFGVLRRRPAPGG
jgi:hypothetical protein